MKCCFCSGTLRCIHTTQTERATLRRKVCSSCRKVHYTEERFTTFAQDRFNRAYNKPTGTKKGRKMKPWRKQAGRRTKPGMVARIMEVLNGG